MPPSRDFPKFAFLNFCLLPVHEACRTSTESFPSSLASEYVYTETNPQTNQINPVLLNSQQTRSMGRGSHLLSANLITGRLKQLQPRPNYSSVSNSHRCQRSTSIHNFIQEDFLFQFATPKSILFGCFSWFALRSYIFGIQ